MSEADIAAQFVTALTRAADEAAGAKTALVTVNVEMIAEGAGQPRTSVTRKTRTMVFLSAEITDASGKRVAIAGSVHRILGAS